MMSVITAAMDLFAHKKEIQLKCDEKFREPWLTVSMKRCNQKCRKLCDKARRTSLEIDHIKYKKYRNVLNRIKVHEKRVHYSTLFKKIGNDSKLLWNVINGLLKKTNNHTEVTSLLHNNSTVTSEKGICEAFNNHFSTVGKRVHESIPNMIGCEYSLGKQRTVKSTLTFGHITEGQVCRLDLKIKLKMSAGLTGLVTCYFKKS